MSHAERFEEMPSDDFRKYEALRSGAIQLGCADAKRFRECCAHPGAQRMIQYSTLIYVDLPPGGGVGDSMDELSGASDWEEDEQEESAGRSTCSFIMKPQVLPPPEAPLPLAARGGLSNAIPSLICNLLALEQLAHDCSLPGLDYGLLERMWALYHPDHEVPASSRRRKRPPSMEADDDD